MKTFITRQGNTEGLVGDRSGPEIEEFDFSQAEQKAKELDLIVDGELVLTCSGEGMTDAKANKIAIGLSESIDLKS